MANSRNAKVDNTDPLANDPLIHQIRQLLNTSGQLSSTDLDKAGNLPLLKEILKLGYKKEGIAPGDMVGMTDKQALGAAIDQLRQGVPLSGQMTREQFDRLATPLGRATAGNQHTTASEEILRSLLAEHTVPGLDKGKAHATVADIINQELGQVRGTKALEGLGPTATPEEQQAIMAKFMPKSAGGAGSPTADTMAQQIYEAGQNQLNSDYQRGLAEIGQYQDEAKLMAGNIPQGLQPIFQDQVAQRSQEMMNNLNLTREVANMQPYVDAISLAAKDYLKGPKASSANTLNQALSSLSKGVGSSGGNLSAISSKGSLAGYDVGNQLQEALKWYGGMGHDFGKFNSFVDSPSQISQLMKLIPSSKSSYKALPRFLAGLGG